jgi:aerobic-type carbon monoxide dehydrogenase small subunit (CoxS/CutS family)
MKFRIRLNGRDLTVETDSNRTLLDVLRTDLGLTGTKYGCGVGACGSCTVIVDGRARCSCLTLIGQVDGRRVETVEGLAEGEKLHPLQESFVENHAIQCGYCTPGMLMSAKAFVDKNPAPSEKEIRVAISGNLCRCTGYKQIVAAIQNAARRIKREKTNSPNLLLANVNRR